MLVNSLREFYTHTISVISSLCTVDTRLTWKEIEFLTECCLYKEGGGDLDDFNELAVHLLKIGFFKRKSDISIYKTKLAAKGWIHSRRGAFDIIEYLDPDNMGDFRFNIEIVYDKNKIK